MKSKFSAHSELKSKYKHFGKFGPIFVKYFSKVIFGFWGLTPQYFFNILRQKRSK